MKKIIYPLLCLSIACIMASCSKDFGSVTVNYTKATAIYDDLTEVRSIPLIGTIQAIDNPGKIFVAEKVLLIGEEGKGIHIIDNSDPANPNPMQFLNIPGGREYYVEGDFLYAESYYDMLKIDISKPNAPELVSRVENAFAQEFTNAKGEVLVGFDYEEVTEQLEEGTDFYEQFYGANEVYYYDYVNQLIPPSAVPASFAGTSNNGIGAVNRIAYQEGYVYVISRSYMTIFKDETDLSFVSTNPVGWQMETIFPHKGKMFVGTQNSMEIFDVSNPEQPQVTASFWHATSCDPVYPVDDVAYVTLRTGDVSNCPGDENSLIVLDISNIGNPVTAQEIEMVSPYGLTLANSKLYVGEGKNGLKIFDATDKMNLTLESFDQSIEAYDVIHHPTNTNILLVAGPNGLGQYEIEGEDRLSLVSWLNL